jgi:hypothetical protein
MQYLTTFPQAAEFEKAARAGNLLPPAKNQSVTALSLINKADHGGAV